MSFGSHGRTDPAQLVLLRNQTEKVFLPYSSPQHSSLISKNGFASSNLCAHQCWPPMGAALVVHAAGEALKELINVHCAAQSPKSSDSAVIRHLSHGTNSSQLFPNCIETHVSLGCQEAELEYPTSVLLLHREIAKHVLGVRTRVLLLHLKEILFFFLGFLHSTP